VQGDITDAAVAARLVNDALDPYQADRQLINKAGVYIGKPFTE
jgi:NADP-dependent 3-hydroxy acid dehydrogenase YdfG